MKNTLFATILLLLASCSTSKKQNQAETNIYWVDSMKKKCVGVASRQCLQIQIGEEMKEDQWEFFYSSIDGFEHETGYIYKLLVKEENILIEDMRADASDIKYTLEKVLEKKQDRKLLLYDIWGLLAVNGENIGRDQISQIEFNLTEMRMLGTDGCNNIFGAIENLDANNLKLGALGSTRKMCPDMEIPNAINQNLGMIRTYKIENLNLTLMDENGKELLRYKKID